MNGVIGFDRAQAQYDAQEPPEPAVFGQCARCGLDIYQSEVDSGLSDGRFCSDCIQALSLEEKENNMESTENIVENPRIDALKSAIYTNADALAHRAVSVEEISVYIDIIDSLGWKLNPGVEKEDDCPFAPDNEAPKG